MRVLPRLYSNGNFINSTMSVHKKTDNNNLSSNNIRHSHQYTGNASADLAYASMFDSEIARDLKMMGLI